MSLSINFFAGNNCIIAIPINPEKVFKANRNYNAMRQFARSN